MLIEAETALDYTARLIMTEELKDLPFADIWDAFCDSQNVPTGTSLMAELERYDQSVSARG